MTFLMITSQTGFADHDNIVLFMTAFADNAAGTVRNVDGRSF